MDLGILHHKLKGVRMMRREMLRAIKEQGKVKGRNGPKLTPERAFHR